MSTEVAAPAAIVAACVRCPKPGPLRCTLCREANYCSQQCQKKDWELGHKIRCKELRQQKEAAAAAAAAEPGSSSAPPPSSSPPLESDLPADGEDAVSLRAPSRWLYPPSELPPLFESAAPMPLRPVGLRNPQRAQSCFFNVVLQMLTYTAPWSNFMERLAHGPDDCVVAAAGRHCTLCALERHRQAVLQRSREAVGSALPAPLLPVELLKNLSALNSDYVLGQQEDSQETIKCMLHVVDEIWRKNANAAAAAAESPEGQQLQSSSSAAQPARLSQRTLETTPISQLFGGYLLSQLRCAHPSCGRTTSSFEHMLDLSLELIDATDELPEMLEAFSRVEKLDAANAWKCGHCQKATRARKQITIFQQPNVLMLQLKRFRYGTFGKVNKYVHFPTQLSLRPYMSACQRRREEAAAGAGGPQPGTGLDTPYDLYGVIVHLDLMNVSSFGHYICYIREPARSPERPARWLRFDDDEIALVSVEEVLRQRAYICFYQRREPFVSDEAVADPAEEAAEEAKAAAAAASSASSSSSGDPAAAAEAPVQCIGGCGFWGKPATNNMCSQCFRKWQEERGEAPPKPAAPLAAPSARRPAQTGEQQAMAAMALVMQRRQMEARAAAAAAAAAKEQEDERKMEALQRALALARLQEKPAAQPVATVAAATAAAEPSNGEPLKQCSSCHRQVSAAAYSSAQLKKQGKRVCKSCVEKQAAAAPPNGKAK